MAGIDQYTVLILHCDGADTSTTFTDSSTAQAAKTVTAVGNAQVDTAQSKFGGASLLLDGSGDYLSIPDSADWDFGTGDFTIDFWIRFSSISGATAYSMVDRNSRGEFTVRRGSDDALQVWLESTEYNFGTWSPSADTWYHVAAVRSSTDLEVFINGTQLGSTLSSSDNVQGTAAVNIGRRSDGIEYITGWMDEIRISKGVARWTANFTPETTAYSGTTNSSNFLMFLGA